MKLSVAITNVDSLIFEMDSEELERWNSILQFLSIPRDTMYEELKPEGGEFRIAVFPESIIHLLLRAVEGQMELVKAIKPNAMVNAMERTKD